MSIRLKYSELKPGEVSQDIVFQPPPQLLIQFLKACAEDFIDKLGPGVRLVVCSIGDVPTIAGMLVDDQHTQNLPENPA